MNPLTLKEGPRGERESTVGLAMETASTARIEAAGAGGLVGARALRVLILVGVTVLVAAPAIVLRVWSLGAVGFNSDEAVYAGQAAAIAGDPQLAPLFPAFRAHPLLFQLLTSFVYQSGVSDLAARLLAVGFGLATVGMAYAVGARIYGRRAGILAALFAAVMPYLVVVNRQALLDGPMVFFSVLALWLVATFVAEQRRSALYAAGAALGLAFLTKETAILLVPSVYAFVAVTPKVRVRLVDIGISLGAFALVGLVYPLSQAFAGGSSAGKHFLVWQLFREPNHTWYFYASVVPLAIGIPLVILAAGALILAKVTHSWSWRESLLVCWIAVPVFFFQVWPVKGFQYLLPIAVPVAVLAAGMLADLGRPGALWLVRVSHAASIKMIVAVVVVVWLALASWQSITAVGSGTFLAGSGGVRGGREAGRWIAANAPAGVSMLSIGPSMANILQFYGHHRVLGLSVSPNPLHRNPAYVPVTNPDLLLSRGDVQYLVWDSYSAERSPYFSSRLMYYVRRYHGTVAHVETIRVDTSGGRVLRPVIVIYEVRP